MKQLVYEINIAAPKEKVWDIMLAPETFKEWTAVSWPGSFYQGKWEQGEKMRFVSDNGSGTLVIIHELTPYKYMGAEHIAILNPGGGEDTTSDLARDWVGSTECYTFRESAGTTDLRIDIGTAPQWEQMFGDGWPNALLKLKEMCER